LYTILETMLEKYQQIKQKYLELEKSLQDPQVMNDTKRLQDVSQEYHDLKPVFDNIIALEQTQADLKTAEKMLEGTDDEMKLFAQDEIDTLEKKQQRLQEELRIQTRPTDPNDKKNVIVEIRAGAG